MISTQYDTNKIDLQKHLDFKKINIKYKHSLDEIINLLIMDLKSLLNKPQENFSVSFETLNELQVDSHKKKKICKIGLNIILRRDLHKIKDADEKLKKVISAIFEKLNVNDSIKLSKALNTFSSNERILFMEILSIIPIDNYSKFVNQLLLLYQSKNCTAERFLSLMIEILEENPGSNFANTFLSYVSMSSDKFSTLVSIKKIEKNQRAEILQKALFLLKNSIHPDQSIAILEVIAELRSKEIDFPSAKPPFEFLKVLKDFLEHKKISERLIKFSKMKNSFSNCLNVLKMLLLIPKEQRNPKVAENIIRLFSFLQDELKAASIAEGMVQFPEKERAILIEHTLQFCIPMQLQAAATLIVLMHEINAYPMVERAIFSKLNSFKWIDCNKYIEILHAVKEIPLSERENILNIAKNYYKNNGDIENFIYIMKCLQGLPDDQKNDEYVLNLLKIANAYDKDFLKNKIKNIPAEDRFEVVSIACNLVDANFTHILKSNILDSLSKFPSSERSILNKVKPLTENIDNSAIHLMINAIQEIPFNHRNLLIEKIEPFLEFVTNAEKRISLLKLMNKSLNNESYILFLLSLAKVGIDISEYNLSRLFKFLDKNYLNEAAEVILSNGNVIKKKNLNITQVVSLLLQNSSIRERAYANLMAELKNSDSNDLLWKNANYIFNNRDMLLLSEEDDLFQEAVLAITVADPALKNSPKNPFTLYNFLKNQKNDTPIFFDPEYESVCGSKIVKWDLQGLRDSAQRETFSYKGGDLPNTVDSTTLKMLYETLIHRVDRLSEDDQKIIENYIQSFSHGKSIKTLQSNIDTKFVNKLLSGKENKDQCIDPAKFYLFSILDAILKSSKEIQTGCCLSESEEMLLKLSPSETLCEQGQRDRISNFFNILPFESKKGLSAPENNQIDASENRVLEFIESSIQSILSQTFENEEFLKQILNQNIVSQQAHLTEFIKNRFANQVGFKRSQMIFDIHTNVLPDSLLAVTPKEFLKTFFEHCTIHNAIKKIQVESDSLLNPSLYAGTMALLNKIGLVDYEVYFEVDENWTPIRLTEEGTLALLKAANYVR